MTALRHSRTPPFAPAAIRGIAAAAAVFLFSSPLAAQEPEEPFAADPSAAFHVIRRLLAAGEAEEGLQKTSEVIVFWGDRGKEEYGPGFGHFFYLRGLLLMELERYREAINDFQTCYEEYSNDLPIKQDPGGRMKIRNRFRIHSLAQWANCCARIEDHEDAIRLYEKAMAESRTEQIRLDVIAVNLGRNYLRHGDTEKGKDLLLKALDSPSVSTELKQAAFLILAEDWSLKAPMDEVSPFIWKYGGIVREDTRVNRWNRNPFFAYLARLGLQTGEPLRALQWYSFLLNPQELVEHQESVLADLEKRKPEAGADGAERLESQKKEWLEKIAESRKMVAAMLLGVGAAHYQLQNFSASYAAFRHVVDAFPEHPKHPEALYNLVSGCVQLKRWQEARDRGIPFLKNYPEHPLMPEVASMMVESVYLIENWDEALATAGEVRSKLEPLSPARDVPDFVAAAALFHLDRLEEAEAEIEAYLKNYEEPRRLEPATYYHGSVKLKLFKWDQAVAILEGFLKDFRASPLTSSALYQAALCRFVLGDLDDAEAKVAVLQGRFPDAEEIPLSWNLQGDILASRVGYPLEEAALPYRKARELASARPDQSEVAAYAIWKLILLHGQERLYEPAVDLYHDFLANHPGSRHEMDVIAASLVPLIETGHAAEAESMLQAQIAKYAGDAEGDSLSDLFGSYMNFLKEQYLPEAALAKIRDFPAPSPVPPPLQAWLIIAGIELRELASAHPEDEDFSKDYYEIQLGIDRRQTPNYALVKLARWNAKTGNRERARELYEYVIDQRPGGGHIELALFDLGQMLVDSVDPAEQARALRFFERVLREFQLPELHETATLGAARLLTKQEKYPEAETWWRAYLDQPNWLGHRPEANFHYGRCLEEQGKTDQALKVYVNVYVNFPGHLDWSTQAYLGAANILKAEGNHGDALLVLVDMLKRLGHLDHRNIQRARVLFDKWKTEWMANQ